MRPDPPGSRASTAAAWPAAECRIQPRSMSRARSPSTVFEHAVRHGLHRPRPRHRLVARLELKPHAAVRRHAGWGPAQPVGVLG